MQSIEANGGVSQRISKGIVALYKEQLGRGPTKVRTWVTDDMVVTVLRDSLTQAETTLAQSNRADAVRDLRRTLQAAMVGPMEKLIEETTHRKVLCVLSDHSPDPDYAVEVILLEPEGQGSADENGSGPD